MPVEIRSGFNEKIQRHVANVGKTSGNYFLFLAKINKILVMSVDSDVIMDIKELKNLKNIIFQK